VGKDHVTHINAVGKTQNWIPTGKFSSINSHKKNEQSRRDDMESLIYCLLYFLKGGLPWDNLKTSNRKDENEKFLKMKSSMSIEELCKDAPKEFATCLEYCRGL